MHVKVTYICGNKAIYVVRHELLASLLDLHMWKESYISGKSPIYVERDLYMWKNCHIRRSTRTVSDDSSAATTFPHI